MAPPSFQSAQAARRRREVLSSTIEKGDTSSDPAAVGGGGGVSASTIKSATRTRLLFAIFTSLLFLIALVFLVLVEIGNISASSSILGSIYFIKLDLSDIVPQSVPNFQLVNSIARTLGLHDFYQVGLWNYCQGYGDEITDCSDPQALYWFNPVEIILSQLLAGATIALPTAILDALDLVKLASQWMFSLFMAGACCSFVAIFVMPLSVYTRWATLPIAIFAFLSALMTTAATLIATVMFLIFKNVVQDAEEDINIEASLGTKMFAFMWIAAVCTMVGWIVQLSLCCCCASRRDVQKGRKTGREKAWRKSGEVPPRARKWVSLGFNKQR